MTPSKLNNLLEFLRKFGGQSISYSTLQNDLDHLVIEGKGYAAYGSKLGQNFVLGRPICADKNIPVIVDELAKKLKYPAFVQIDKETAKLLYNDFGYKITRMGVETVLPVQCYELEGDSKKNNLRISVKKGSAVADVHELNQAQLKELFNIDVKDLEEISQEWLATKTSKKPLRFLVRQAVYGDEPYVRKFYSVNGNNEPLGFIFFDPIFSNREVIGYCPSVMRARPSAPMGHAAYILLKAMEKFKSEDKRLLSLGLSPISPSKSFFRHDLTTFYALKLLYAYGNTIYNFKGMRYYKNQYRGLTSDMYIATKKVFSGFESLAIARFCGFI